jgi:PAS domain-containing protein
MTTPSLKRSVRDAGADNLRTRSARAASRQNGVPSDELLDDERVRMTIRVRESLRAQLKAVAAAQRQSVEGLIEETLERELSAGAPAAEPLDDWGPDLAKRFLDCLPTPVVVKDTDAKAARIVWCNMAYEDIVGSVRERLVGQRIGDTGLVDQASARRIERDIDALKNARGRHAAREFWEPVVFHARSPVTTIVRAYRFVFDANQKKFIGDISFDWSQILPGPQVGRPADYRARLRRSVATDPIKAVLATFLASSPVAIAIKNDKAQLVWCNAVYERLSKRPLKEIRGLTAQQIFSLSDEDPLVQNEHTVLQSDVWMYTTEALPDRNPRTSLRFRISDAAGNVGHMGTVSAEFQQDDIRSQRVIRKGRR